MRGVAVPYYLIKGPTGSASDRLTMTPNRAFETMDEAERALQDARAREPEAPWAVVEASSPTEALMRAMSPGRELRVRVAVIRTTDEMAAALSVRRRVFIEEQGVSEAEEIDEHDADPATVTTAVHVLGRLEGSGMPVATARLLLDHPPGEHPHVGRVAVLAEFRRHGFGRAVMEALHEEARRRGERGITLAAQLHAIPFYERLGYTVRGHVFLDAGIEHRWMDVAL